MHWLRRKIRHAWQTTIAQISSAHPSTPTAQTSYLKGVSIVLKKSGKHVYTNVRTTLQPYVDSTLLPQQKQGQNQAHKAYPKAAGSSAAETTTSPQHTQVLLSSASSSAAPALAA